MDCYSEAFKTQQSMQTGSIKEFIQSDDEEEAGDDLSARLTDYYDE